QTKQAMLRSGNRYRCRPCWTWRARLHTLCTGVQNVKFRIDRLRTHVREDGSRSPGAWTRVKLALGLVASVADQTGVVAFCCQGPSGPSLLLSRLATDGVCGSPNCSRRLQKLEIASAR